MIIYPPVFMVFEFPMFNTEREADKLIFLPK